MHCHEDQTIFRGHVSLVKVTLLHLLVAFSTTTTTVGTTATAAAATTATTPAATATTPAAIIKLQMQTKLVLPTFSENCIDVNEALKNCFNVMLVMHLNLLSETNELLSKLVDPVIQEIEVVSSQGFASSD